MKLPAPLVLAGALILSASGTALAEHKEGVGADAALERLIEGNKRYIEASFANPDRDSACRTRLSAGQEPFAVIVGCSDSRVPPEVIFDQGLGALFVIRVAGNVADDVGLASIEYAVEHLGTHLVLVLGHERCGAVTAAVKGGELPGHLPALMALLKPAVDASQGKAGDGLDNAIRENVALVAQQLRDSRPVIAELVEKGQVKVVGARYDLDTGAVEILP